MHLIILGSGTIVSGKDRNPSGYLLQSSSVYALLDFGPGNLRRLQEQEIPTCSINAIFLSHFHLDHCSDVFPLLLNRYLLQNDSNSLLTIYGPAGLKTWFDSIAAGQGSWLHNCLPQLVELDGQTIEWGGQKIYAGPSQHNGASLAYRVEGKQTLFYSGDTEYAQQLIALARQADLAIVECSHSEAGALRGHMTPSACGRLATEAAVKQLVLTHMYPENDTPDLAQRAQKHFNGPVTVAQDGMSFVLD